MSGDSAGGITDPAEQNKILQYLSNEITSEWLFVGLNLKVPQGKLEQIKMNNQGNQRLINHTMLSEWLREGQNKSKQFLAKALLDSGRRDLHDWVLG